MTEDTRRWANADAGTAIRIGSGITDFNVAQAWTREEHERPPQVDFSTEDLEESVNGTSQPAETPEKPS